MTKHKLPSIETLQEMQKQALSNEWDITTFVTLKWYSIIINKKTGIIYLDTFE